VLTTPGQRNLTPIRVATLGAASGAFPQGKVPDVTTMGDGSAQAYKGEARPASVMSIRRVLQNQIGPKKYVDAMTSRVMKDWGNTKVGERTKDGNQTTTATTGKALDIGGGLSLPAGTTTSDTTTPYDVQDRQVEPLELKTPNGASLKIGFGSDASSGQGYFTVAVESARGKSEPVRIMGVPVVENGQVSVWRNLKLDSGQVVSRKLSLFDSIQAQGSADKTGALAKAMASAFGRP
jgi:hypothetical protein